ncbi:tetratricopeptide repeat-containing sulfotransferase family protein [Agaribacter flavus]|uniref:Tetratricopeptide repeat-containing sulfotransferase family protein n=1 Tax=Agaribacter flavus TaxID=1902781 RepID=A0ABV7FM02_9ALTE
MNDIDREKVEAHLLLMAQGKYEQVHASAIALIHKNTRDPLPYFLLAKLCLDHQNYKKAAELFEKSLMLDMQNEYALTYFAQTLTKLGEHARAREYLTLAEKGQAQSAHLCDTIGVVHSITGFHENALPWFRKAIQLDPEPVNYHFNLAASLQFLGKFEDAEIAYKSVLRRQPSHYRALSALVSLKKQTTQDNIVDQLQKNFELYDDNPDAKLHLGHALAKIYEDLGDYSESFTWLRKAKADKLKASSTLDYKKIFTAAKGTVSKDTAFRGSASQRRFDINDNEALRPIFIVGLPRTGTTLVDRILSSHQAVTAAGELNTFANIVKKLAQTQSNLVMDTETFDASKKLDMDAIGQMYLEATAELRRASRIFTDKMPLNFFYAGLIHQALPNARIIVLRRHAMDSCLSNYRQLLTVQHAYYNYTYDINSIAEFYRSFDDLICHWRHHLPAERFLEVHYEDIVFDQVKQTKRLLDFCGLDWDEACLRFHENTAAVSTASSVQVRKPLYSGSIGRWKRYGSQLDELKLVLGDLL